MSTSPTRYELPHIEWTAPLWMPIPQPEVVELQPEVGWQLWDLTVNLQDRTQ